MEKLENKLSDRIILRLTSAGETLKSEMRSFAVYMKQNYLSIILFCSLFLLLFGSWIYNTNSRIDTNNFIVDPSTYFNWLRIGRQGGILTEYVFGLRFFNPYFITIVGYLMLCAAGILFGYLFWRTAQRANWGFAAFTLLYFCSPIFAEHFYFDMQIFKIAWAYVLCSVSTALVFYGALHRSYPAKIIAFLLFLWIFSTYQTFLFVVFSAIVLCFALLFRRRVLEAGTNETLSSKSCAILIAWIAGIFVAAAIVNQVITSLFFADDLSAHLFSQIRWGSYPIADCVKTIFTHLYEGFFGIGSYYTYFYAVFAFLAVGCMIADVIRSKNKGLHAQYWYVLSIVGLQLSPFLLTFVSANTPNLRSQIAYPFTIACNIAFLGSRAWNLRIQRLKIATVLLAVLAALSVFTQAGVTARLIYTDDVRAREDEMVAVQLENCFNELSDPTKPVAFIGAYESRLNNACLRGEIIGRSVFSWLPEGAPH